jgi:hypothetical protein
VSTHLNPVAEPSNIGCVEGPFDVVHHPATRCYFDRAIALLVVGQTEKHRTSVGSP